MTKRLLIVFLALGLTFYNSGCSSGGSKEDGDVASANDDSFAEEGEGDFADEASAEEPAAEEPSVDANAEGTEQAAEEPAAPEGGDDELALEEESPDAGAEPTAKSAEAETAPPEDELALEDDGALPEEVAGGENSDLVEDEPPAKSAQVETQKAPPPVEEPTFTAEPPPADDTKMAESTSPAVEPPTSESSNEMVDHHPAPAPVAASFVPVQKIKDAPFTKNGALLNRVYVARPGDDLKGVSKKIYGSNRAKDLVKWNPNLGRGLKTGDKVYYSSPGNPTDQRMLTYYEDMGVQPSVYTSKPGDNIRRVSKQLLGSNESWKEVWATNPNVENKGDIPGGLELRYWPEGAAPVAASSLADLPHKTDPAEQLAQQPPAFPNESAQPAPPPQAAQPPPSMPAPDMKGDPLMDPSMQPPPPPTNVAGQMDPSMPHGGDAMAPPPPPPPDMAAAGSTGAPSGVDPLAAPPEPPPPIENPPASKPVKRPAAASNDEGSGMGSDPDTLMMIAFGGVLLLLAAVLIVVIRKNRAKRMVDLSQTQV